MNVVSQQIERRIMTDGTDRSKFNRTTNLRRLVVVTAMVSVLVLGIGSRATATSEAQATARTVLVVGDSLVVQATSALDQYNRADVTIVVDGGSGSAPCDWESGYLDPFSKRYLDFESAFNAAHPSTVVLAFTGNPGLDSTTTGCVDSSGNYSLGSLLANYRTALTAMATYASQHGATVYLSASPPRNPATAAGSYSDGSGDVYYGFNGVGQINELYQSMVRSAAGRRFHWVYDTDAAVSVSNSNLSWQLTETCTSAASSNCQDGRVQVRDGGYDAIHLDTSGAGATLYAAGLLRRALGT
jgi:hypothetical protein